MYVFKTKRSTRVLAVATAAVMLLTGVAISMGQASAAEPVPVRPQGPCDIYDKYDLPCWSAHSTTRALRASWDGPLYQVQRRSDNALKDIPVVQPSPGDAGGYADAGVQDSFCVNTYCEITRMYDQSGAGNDLYRAPRGNIAGDYVGGADNNPMADWAPISVFGGKKVYGVSTAPAIGLRNNDPSNPVVDDMPESEYWVVDGRVANGGCCFGYGNGETDGRDDGNGTMEALAFSNARYWHQGVGPGPWLMTDQENNLIGCSGDGTWMGVSGYDTRFCTVLETVNWRWAASFADFGSKSDTTPDGFWSNRGANVETGQLTTYWNGKRLNDTYNPMRKQGAIYFATGGDNGVYAQGTLYEAALAHGTATEAIDREVLSNIQTVDYDEYRLVFEPVGHEGVSGNLMTYGPGISKDVTLSWTNTTGVRAAVVLSVASTGGFGISPAAKTFLTGVAPGETVSQVFKVTGGAVENNDDLVGTVDFLTADLADTRTEIAIMHARNVPQISINEFSIQGTSNATNSFIELYNNGATAVDVSGWTLTYRPQQQASFSDIKVPEGTVIAAKSFYVFGLSTSGLATAAKAGDTNIKVRLVTGMSAGNTITIGTGTNAETATISTVGTAAPAPAVNSTVFMQLPPDCPVKNCPNNSADTLFPAGTNNLLFTVAASNFSVGSLVQVGYGDNLEVLQVAEVGLPGAQIWLAPNTNASGFQTHPHYAVAGATNLKVSSVTSIRAGMVLRLDIDAKKEYVKVKTVGTAGVTGTGVELEQPLQFTHSNNMPIAIPGTGLTFTTPTQFDHYSSEPLRPLGTGITLSAPLTKNHPIEDVVLRSGVTTAGFQGTPNQWYGGPAMSTDAGSMVLKTAKGNVVDSLNYGRNLVDPWLGEGFQKISPTEGVVTSSSCRPNTVPSNFSAGRYPDGNDTDRNCLDFLGSTRTPGAPSAYNPPTGAMVSLQFAKDPDQYVMHKDRNVFFGTPKTVAEKASASYYAVPALSGTSGCVSFMSADEIGSYLFIYDYKYFLMPFDGSTIATRASFCPVKTVGTSSAAVSIQNGPEANVMFRSVSSNTRYMRLLYGMYNDDKGVFIAANGVVSRPYAGDTPTNWTQDIVWNAVEGLAMDTNKAALQALVDKVNALNSGHYVNWTFLIPAPLAAAQSVLDIYGGPSKAVIQAAYDALEAAMKSLTPINTVVVMTNPVITGDAMVGHTLSVSANPFPTDAVLTYQWYVSDVAPCDTNGVAIAGQTANTYLVQATDAGKYVCAKVTASLDGVMAPVSKFSNDASIQIPIAVNKAVLTGSNAVGGVATIDLAYTPTDSTYTVEWYRNGSLIAGANSLAYTITQADSGTTLVAKITVSKAGYDSLTVFTNSVTVLGDPAPTGEAILTPVGPVTAGQVVTLTANVTPAGAFTLAEWYVGGSVVMISTNPFGGSTYTPTAADAGKTIVVKLTIYVPSFSPLVVFSNVVDVI